MSNYEAVQACSSIKTNLLDLDRPKLEEFFLAQGEKTFRATQVLKWIYQQKVLDFSAMTNLSKSLRDCLLQKAECRVPLSTVLENISADGTVKWLLRLDDGNNIETVFIPEAKRGTLCVSSQVGCALNCSFCSTGKQGFNRNLSTAEIIGQVWFVVDRLTQIGAPNHPGVTNVVMMGMGEPLLNFDNVIPAMELMMDDFAFGLAKRRVTLSTSGVIPAMENLAKISDVALAVSLHAPNDALRDILVPINKKYPLKELMRVCRYYFADEPRRKITFEYVMLDGINDSPELAHELVKLLRGIPGKVNLIPFNPFPFTQYRRSSQKAIDRFGEILQNAGITTIVRRTRGDDIDAACGQLVGEFTDKTRRHERYLQELSNSSEAL